MKTAALLSTSMNYLNMSQYPETEQKICAFFASYPRTLFHCEEKNDKNLKSKQMQKSTHILN